MRLSLACLVIIAASCATVPPFRHGSAEGTVLAHDPAVAANVAAALDELAPLVKSYLNSRKDIPVIVHVVENETHGSYIIGSHIELSRELDTEKRLRFALYHELVHWYGEGTWIDSLPLYVEEGVADYLSCEHIDAVELRRAEKPLPPGATLNLTELGMITPAKWQKLDKTQTDFMRRAGFYIAYHVGIPSLRAAASAGPLSPDDILRLLHSESPVVLP